MFEDIIQNLNSSFSSINRDRCKDIVLDIHKIIYNKETSEDEFSFPIINEVFSDKTNVDNYLERHKNFPDKYSANEVRSNTDGKIDIKLFFVKNLKKKTVSWIQNITPNFEDDEIIYEDNNVGIDFCFDPKTNRFLIVLSKENVVKTFEIRERVKPTDYKILKLWYEFDFLNSSKKEIHEFLWDSFDLEPINSEFYKNIRAFYISLTELNNISGIELYSAKLIGKLIFLRFLMEKNFLNKSALEINKDSDQKLYFDRQLKTTFQKLDDADFNKEVGDDTVFIGSSVFEESDLEYKISLDINFPENYFFEFFSFLEKFNFTTDESTSDYLQIAIDPEMMGQIFEQLLAEINSDTEEVVDKRSEKGAFYTPRNIVDEICTKSLVANFESNFDDKNIIREFNILTTYPEIEFLKISDDFFISEENKEKIFKFLSTRLTLDPACGSGAFPIGMLNTLMKVVKRLNIKNTNSYEVKRNLLEKSIFGIDIEPTAIEVTKLRALLSLLIEEEFSKESNYFLPNLELNFICANALLPLSDTLSSEENVKLEEQLSKIRKNYYSNANDKNFKSSLKKKYLIAINQNQSLFSENSREEQIKSFNPFVNNSVSDFYNSNIMFNVPSFDIIVGNPPYINAQDMKKNQPELRKKLKNIYNQAVGTWDLFIPFIELGLMSICKNGVLSMIVKNTLISSSYAQKTRNELTSLFLKEVVDYSSLKIFKDASVYPSTFLVVNSKNNSSQTTFKNWVQSEGKFTKNTEILESLGESWSINFLDPNVKKIYDKIHSFIDNNKIYNFSAGLTTGMAYDVKKVLQNDKDPNEDHFKIITSGLIDSFNSKWGFIVKPILKKTKSKYLDEEEDAKYPIISHQELEAIQSQKVVTASSKKLIVAGMIKPIKTFYDSIGEYLPFVQTFVLDVDNFDQEEIDFLYRYLNSNLFTFLLFTKFSGDRVGGGYLSLKKEMLNQPFYPNRELLQNIALLPKENIAILNEKINALFQLDPDEVRIMENFIYSQ